MNGPGFGLGGFAMWGFLRRLFVGDRPHVDTVAAVSEAEDPPVRARKSRAKKPKLVMDRLERPLLVDVRGESGTNADGVSRHSIIAGLKVGESVKLVLRYDELHGREEIDVRSRLGVIGELPHSFRDTLIPMLHHKVDLRAEISDIRGGTPQKPNFGVWLTLTTPAG
jgi:hypothetical protein